MSIFRWLEEKLFTGQVIQDFGPIYKKGTAAIGETHTLLLCRKWGQEWITSGIRIGPALDSALPTLLFRPNLRRRLPRSS